MPPTAEDNLDRVFLAIETAGKALLDRTPETLQLGPTTQPTRGFEKARGWLRECLEHHDCGTRAHLLDPKQYPKRLLDLRGNRVRLFETSTDGNRFQEPYVCLSHRWGAPRHRRLTSTVHSIRGHLQNISWYALPKTFRDAVTICRKMSVEYLWIDSLCILQEFRGMTDDEAKETENDFAQQNAMMSIIYQNSLFTISADISTSMTSGIFRKKFVFLITPGTTHSLGPTDLETRGWTFQEYVLPARVLSFGPFEISWRCQRLQDCECEEMEGSVFFTSREILARDAMPASLKIKDLENWWRTMVNYYSPRKLTNEQDKLPAMSGLAQLYHRATGHRYLAGLWEEFLPQGLCWYHAKKAGSYPLSLGVGQRTRDFRSPTWSWASLDAIDDASCFFWWPGHIGRNPIEILGGQPRSICTIYEIVCDPATTDPFGRVEPGAFIDIGAMLIPATIVVVSGSKENEASFSREPENESLAWSLKVNQEDRRIRYCLPDCRLADDDLHIGDEVYCAPLLEDLTKRSSDIGCLVLKPLPGGNHRRVGFCILEKDNPHYDWDCDENRGWHWYSWCWSKADPAVLKDYAFQYRQEVEARITIV